MIWESLVEPKTLLQLTARVIEMYDVPEEQARADVLSYLQQMQEADLIKIVIDAIP